LFVLVVSSATGNQRRTGGAGEGGDEVICDNGHYTEDAPCLKCDIDRLQAALAEKDAEIERLRYGRAMLRFMPLYSEIKTCMERIIYYYEDKHPEEHGDGMAYAIEEAKAAIKKFGEMPNV
jgi:hypothetical protein